MISLFKKIIDYIENYRYYKWVDKDKEYITNINTNHYEALKKIKSGACIYCGGKTKDKKEYSICENCRSENNF